jgi:hypothetical protein
MTLTVKEINEKIEQVQRDLEKVRGQPDGSRKAEMLEQYIDYLKDELKEASRGNRT